MFETQITSIKESAKEYVDLRLELVKLQSVEILSNYLSSMLYVVITMLVVMVMLVFVSIGAALLINQNIESDFGGFLIVSGVYMLLLAALVIFRKSIIENLLRNPLIKNLVDVIHAGKKTETNDK